MAADDEQVGVVLLGRVAEHVPGLPFDHLDQSVHLHRIACNLGKKEIKPLFIINRRDAIRGRPLLQSE